MNFELFVICIVIYCYVIYNKSEFAEILERFFGMY